MSYAHRARRRYLRMLARSDPLMTIRNSSSMQTHCSYCGCKTLPSPDEQSPYRVLDGVNRHQKRRSFDHIFPREWGGKDAADNFRVSCQDCNEFRAECGHCVGAMACVLAVTSKESWSVITRPRFLAREWFRVIVPSSDQ